MTYTCLAQRTILKSKHKQRYQLLSKATVTWEPNARSNARYLSGSR